MKKKIMITSIFLGFTAVAIVVYLGCGRQGGDTESSGTAIEKSSEEADAVYAYADVTETHDSEVQMLTKPQDTLSQLQKEVKDKDRLHIKYGELKSESIVNGTTQVVTDPVSERGSEQEMLYEMGRRSSTDRNAGMGGVGGMGRVSSGGGMMGGMGGMSGGDKYNSVNGPA
ncbi:MAG: hypothetical protein ACYS6K_15525, partial [Planctomycetota bacterium]